MLKRWRQKITGLMAAGLLLLIWPAAPGLAAPAAKGVQKTAVADGSPAVVKKKPAPGVKPGVKLKVKDEKRILARIREKFRRPELMQGRFTQTTTFADSTDTMVASGRIWLQGPDKMRWEYAEPEKQVLVSDGRNIWYYTSDLNQVMTGSVKDIKEARIIVNLLSRLDNRIEGFNLETRRDKNRLVLILVPLVMLLWQLKRDWA